MMMKNENNNDDNLTSNNNNLSSLFSINQSHNEEEEMKYNENNNEMKYDHDDLSQPLINQNHLQEIHHDQTNINNDKLLQQHQNQNFNSISSNKNSSIQYFMIKYFLSKNYQFGQVREREMVVDERWEIE